MKRKGKNRKGSVNKVIRLQKLKCSRKVEEKKNLGKEEKEKIKRKIKRNEKKK